MKFYWLIGGLVVVLGIIAVVSAFMYDLPLDLRDRSPVQPLVFSHKVHAGKDGIQCLFCHRYAEKSPVAGILPVETCVKTCHPILGLNIKDLNAYWERRQPIPWVRVYVLPDHVYFPHMMHIRAGLVCANCHGDVASMEPLTRHVKLEMGWCLNCHRQKNVGIDCWMCHK
ncbi:MAG TPA: cytochrome c3 family protein [Geobacteraceae bacterium]|nr:cytochrome c3 family protein [Geobacteraceae bacterium]